MQLKRAQLHLLVGALAAGFLVVGCGGSTLRATSPSAKSTAAPSPRPSATIRLVSDASSADVNKVCRLGNRDYTLYLGKHTHASLVETAREFTLTRKQILAEARQVNGVSNDVLQALSRGVTLAVQGQAVVEKHTDGHPLIAASMGLAKTFTGLGLDDCARVR
jgi:hypothetical protein